ncbi:TonB-dependent receptor [Pseudohalioglobus sediminis]|uniref:TonB-dependent receptor n=2 Tax=Pseudohalioglobus sediminis TaxID=2606449 RepID=A0A5B0X5G7_9GAMM|nr:TonB-dependent receptor [Pseudohalioglobus sediminis]
MLLNTNATPNFRRTMLASALSAAAVSVSAQDLVLEEVVVTAQKRTENVQDVAATVNVVSGQDLDKFAVFDFRAIEQQTAGLTLSSPNARNSTISLRGVSIDPESGVSAAVDVYWNDAVVRPDVAFSQMYDLERIEILRGPQGTLQGATSPGGALNMITRRAGVDQASGYVSASVADNNGLNAQVAYGTPLIDGTLGIRVAGVYDTDNGADVQNLTSGFDDQELEAYSGRISTTWLPTDTFEAQFIYQYLDRTADDPKAMAGADALAVRPRLRPVDNKALGKTDNYGDFDFNVANLVMSWDVADLQLTGLVAYQDSHKTSATELDRANSLQLTEIVAPTFQQSTTDVESWVYEFRVASTENVFWNYMVGLYHRDQQTSTEALANSVRLGGPIGALGFQSVAYLPLDASEFAVFTFNTFDLADTVQLEFGLRWTDYDRTRRADVEFEGLTYLPPAFESLAELISDRFSEGFPIIGVPKDKQSASEDAWTGSLAVRWDWRDDTNLYASYNRGYRPSGISIVPSPTIEFLPNGVDDLLHDEETSDAFELGFKSRLWNDRASLNGALYYQTFEGYLGFVRGTQVIDDTGAPIGLPGGLIFNGDATIWGVELDGRVLLGETWDFGGALSYSKGEWDGVSAPCNDREPGEVLGTCDLDGKPLGGEPEWSISLNSEYFIPLENDSEVYVRGLFKYTDERQNTDASAGLGQVAETFESYQVLDLFVGWRSSDYSWDISLWGKNVFDEDAVTFEQGPDQYDVALSGGSYTQTNILPERVVGVTARYSF